MKRCIIIGGAPINNYEKIKKQLNNNDFFIYCDSGLIHQKELGFVPNLIIGDFDSHPNPNLDVETITLPCEKDDTDTFFAAKQAIERGFDEFILIGVIGNRLDHSMANLSILLYLDKYHKNAKIIDDYSEIEVINNSPKYISDDFSYFSILSAGHIISGVSIENAKYALNGAEITNYYAYGISNEVCPGKLAKVEINEGIAYLIKVY